MNGKNWWIGVAALFVAIVSWADSPAKAGCELYSWQAGSNWNYAIFEGSGTVRSEATIRARKNRLRGTPYLKGRLAVLPAGELVYWRVDKSRGFILPPQHIIRELNEYAVGARVKLILPGQDARSKAYEEMGSDLDGMKD